MSILDIIKLLQEQGHQVSFSKRKDGGYIIRRIDSNRFTGKKGNVFARQITGQELSLARKVQLQRIKTPKGQRQKKRTPLPEDLKKELKKVQRAWRKKHPTIEGTISTRGLRYQYEQKGYKEALMSLDKAYRYSEGYAYLDNVNHLVERIRMNLSKIDSPEMEQIVSLIEQKALLFKEEWLAPIYSALYDWERYIIDGKECARIIKSIIG